MFCKNLIEQSQRNGVNDDFTETLNRDYGNLPTRQYRPASVVSPDEVHSKAPKCKETNETCVAYDDYAVSPDYSRMRRCPFIRSKDESDEEVSEIEEMASEQKPVEMQFEMGFNVY